VCALNHFDVVVIGGGIIGCSVSYHLTKAGYDVALVEKGEVASGTSSRCDAVALISDKKPGLDTEFGYKSIEMYKQLAEELSFDFDFSTRGSLYVCETDVELEIAGSYAKDQKAAGYTMDVVDNKTLLNIEPNLAKDLAGGVWTEVDSTMNPYLVCYAFIEEAQKMGLTLYKNHEVLSIKTGVNNQIEAVITDKTTIYTKKAVNCAGVWASKIGELVNINIPIQPRKGIILVTEMTDRIVNQKVHEYGYMLSKFEDIDYIRQVSDRIEDNNIAFTIEPTTADNYLIGGHRAFDGFNSNLNMDVMQGIAERATRFIPKLQEVNCIRAYAGVRPWVVDHLPIVSDVEEVHGFYIAAGHEGDGISLAPITGRIMTQIISEEQTEFDVSQLSFSRYKNNTNKLHLV